MKKIIFFLLTFASIIWAAEITFTFANVTITGTGPSYYEFDVMAQADVAGTRIGDTQVYINYNTAGFGSSVAASGKLTVEKGTLLQGGSAPAFYYNIVNVTDNTDSRFSIANEYAYPDYPDSGNELPTTPTQLVHVKIEIADVNQTAGLSFEQPLMVGQECESDNSAVYSPVVASDTENSSLNPSAIETIAGNGIPDKFALEPNFPNPFNPSTTLRFDVPEQTSNLELIVYDVLGRKVAVLFKGSIQPGTFKFNWNGKNATGATMPTGIYFATLRAGTFHQTIKMMLVK